MLSIVIPIYNRVELLNNALDSLIAQSNRKFIVVVVDDGSTEDVTPIIQKYDQWLNIVYIRQENQGVGAARDTGMDWAIAHNMELLMFMDADDRLLPHAVDTLTYEINHSRAFMVASALLNSKAYHSIRTISTQDALTWTHGKIYRVSALNDLGIRFAMGPKTNEDLFFNSCLKFCWPKEKVLCIEEPTYLWQISAGSITQTDQRTDCLGWDYVRAVYAAVLFAGEKISELTNDIAPNILMAYNYYQVGKTREPAPEDVEHQIRFLYNLPLMKKIFENTDLMHYYNTFLWPYLIDQKHIYYFTEPFGTFLKRITTEEDNAHCSD